MIDCKDCRHCRDILVGTPRPWFAIAVCTRHDDPSYVRQESVDDVAVACDIEGIDDLIAEYASTEADDDTAYTTSCNAERHGPSSDRHCGEDARFFEPKQQETT